MVYVIFDCDEWKSKSSMRLIMVSTPDCLENNLATIKTEHDYTDEDMKTYIYIEEVELNYFC
jgi:hypothetical protein